MTLTTRATVPTVKSSLNVGSSTSGDRWLMTPTRARSRPRRSSTRRTLRGRPTLMGTTDIGKSTELRSGRIGTLSVSETGGGLDGGEPGGMGSH